MSRLIDTGLEQLATMVFRMGELAHKTVALSINGYIENKEVYSEVSDLSETLTTMADEAEDKAFEIMARFQPVASDLRALKSYIKITYDFARYGRYALDVSQVQKKLRGLEECEPWIKKSIAEMSENVLNMVRVSVDSLRSYDAKLAETLSETEKQVDQSYFAYLDRLVEKAPKTTKCTISSVLAVRYLERIADHATYICESVVYLATGEKITLR